MPSLSKTQIVTKYSIEKAQQTAAGELITTDSSSPRVPTVHENLGSLLSYVLSFVPRTMSARHCEASRLLSHPGAPQMLDTYSFLLSSESLMQFQVAIEPRITPNFGTASTSSREHHLMNIGTADLCLYAWFMWC